MPTDIKDLANEILTSWKTGKPIPALPSADGAFDLNAAYAVEAELQRLRSEAGHSAAGRKVGYANKAMWRALKLETLVWASMYDDTIHTGNELPVGSFIAPRIEPEIVFKLSRPVPADGLDAQGALGCVEWMAIGFEIIDCPYPGWQFKPADFVAAFGLHRALVVGEPRPIDAASIPTIADQLPVFRPKLMKNGQTVEEGSGRNSLRSPALCLAELARVTPLRAGEIISTGTLTGAQPIAAGDAWQVEIEGLDLSGLKLCLI